ncbi:hypothetical protein DPMN_039633 [Dreissena polymorpha]|uniref:Uncharacterized protein n=1 Tax=Dreissena polymorpha TaxID=45954 RepID=A0A9D4HUJ7_DREPO|nr:hypothetical protein DPMN_039633 [Dreissena polymorpha]
MAACGLDVALQQKWIADITDMVEECPMVILRLQTIRKAIIASPEPLMWFSETMMELNILHLEVVKRVVQCNYYPGKKDCLDLTLCVLETRSTDILNRL